MVLPVIIALVGAGVGTLFLEKKVQEVRGNAMPGVSLPIPTSMGSSGIFTTTSPDRSVLNPSGATPWSVATLALYALIGLLLFKGFHEVVKLAKV